MVVVLRVQSEDEKRLLPSRHSTGKKGKKQSRHEIAGPNALMNGTFEKSSHELTFLTGARPEKLDREIRGTRSVRRSLIPGNLY